MYPNDSDNSPRKKRASNKVAMAHVSMRVPSEVVDWFRDNGGHHTKAMRDVLVDFVDRHRAS